MQALINDGDIAAAFATLSQQISIGSEEVHAQVGYQGGSEQATLLWHADRELWALLQPNRLPNRYWCAFGIDNPHSHSLVPITCEINAPRSGVNRQCAGLFLRDADGAIYLAHSGKIGGGRKGIGKRAFLETYASRTDVDVLFPNGQTASYI